MNAPGAPRSAPVAVVRPVSEMLSLYLMVAVFIVVIGVAIYTMWMLVEKVYFHFRKVQMKLVMQEDQIYVGDPITVGVKAQRFLPDESVRLRRLTDDGRGPAMDPAQTYEQTLDILEEDSRLIFPELPLPGQYELLYYSSDRKHVLNRLKFVARRPDLNAELLQLMWLDPIKINFTASPIRNSADTIILLRDDADGLEKGEYLPVVVSGGTAQGSAVFSGQARLPGTYTAFYVRSRMIDKKEKGMVLARSCNIIVTGPTVTPQLAWPERFVAGMYKDPLRVDFETGVNRCKADTIVLHKGLWSDPEGRMTLDSGSASIVATLSVPMDALVSSVTFSDVRAPPAPGEYCTLYINAKRVMACSKGFWIHPPIVTALRLPLYYCNPDVTTAALPSVPESIDASRAAKVPVTPWRTPMQFAVLLSKNRSPKDALLLCRRDEKPGTQCTFGCVRELTGVNAYMSAVARPSDDDWQYRPETAALGPISAHCGEIFIVKFDALYCPRMPGIYSVVYVPEGNVKIVPSLKVSLENLDLVVDPSCQHPDLVKFGSQSTGLSGSRTNARASGGYWPWQIFSGGPSTSAQWYAWGNVFAACGALVRARHPSKLVDSASQPLESSEQYTSPIVFDPVRVEFQTVRNPDPSAPQDRIALVPAGHPVNSSSAFLLPPSAGQLNQHILLDPNDLTNRADIIESRLFVEQVQCDQAPQLPGMYQFVYLAAADANTPPLPAGAPASILAASTQHDCLRLYASRPEAMPGYIEIGRSQSFPVRPPDLLVKDATEYPPVAENAPSGVTPAISYNTWLRAYLFGNVDVKPDPPKPKVKVWVYTSANHIDGDYIAITRAGGDPEDLNGGKLKIKIPRGCATHPLVFSSESDMLPRESGRYEAVYIRGSTSSRWFGSAAEERVVFIPASAYQNPALFSHMKSAAISYTRSGAAILCRSEPFCIDVSAVNNLTVGVAEQPRFVSSEGDNAVVRPVAQPHVPKLYPSLAHMPPGSTFSKSESSKIAMPISVPQWPAPAATTVRASAPTMDDDLCSFCRIAVPTKPCSICRQSFCNSCDAKNHPAHRVAAPDAGAIARQRSESSTGSKAIPINAETAAGSTPSRVIVERQVNVDDFAQRNSRRGAATTATAAVGARNPSAPSTPSAPPAAANSGSMLRATSTPSAPPGVSPSTGGTEVAAERPQRTTQVAAPLSLFADITSRNFALSPVSAATKAAASVVPTLETVESSAPGAGTAESNPELAQYEKMLKVGIAIEGVKRKMEGNQVSRELIEQFCRMHGAEELCSPPPKAAPRTKTTPAKPAAVPVEARPPRAAAPSLMDALKSKAAAAAEARAGKPFEDPRQARAGISPIGNPMANAMNGVLANRMARRRTHVDKGRRSDGSESDSGFEFDAPTRR